MLLLAGTLLPPATTTALVIDGDQRSAAKAPADGPGWAHIGRIGGVTGIYLGDGWVLTARHAGLPQNFVLDGVTYPPVPETHVWLDLPGQPGKKSDVALYRIDPAPDLPPLEIQKSRPTVGTRVLLMALGRHRGDPLAFGQRAGHSWTPDRKKLWGTNHISDVDLVLAGPAQYLTRCFSMDFSRDGSGHEAQAALGDSGGAVFVWNEDHYRLGGVMTSIGTYPNQRPKTALYGNFTNAADLSVYATQIEHAMRKQETSP